MVTMGLEERVKEGKGFFGKLKSSVGGKVAGCLLTSSFIFSGCTALFIRYGDLKYDPSFGEGNIHLKASIGKFESSAFNLKQFEAPCSPSGPEEPLGEVIRKIIIADFRESELFSIVEEDSPASPDLKIEGKIKEFSWTSLWGHPYWALNAFTTLGISYLFGAPLDKVEIGINLDILIYRGLDKKPIKRYNSWGKESYLCGIYYGQYEDTGRGKMKELFKKIMDDIKKQILTDKRIILVAVKGATPTYIKKEKIPVGEKTATISIEEETLLQSSSFDFPSYTGTKYYLSVFPLQPKNIPEKTTSILSDSLETSLSQTSYFKLVERTSMETILKEQRIQLTDCFDDKCQVEIGKLVGAEKIVYGTLSKIEDTYSLTLKLTDVASGIIEATAQERCKCKGDELFQLVDVTAKKLSLEYYKTQEK